MAFKLYERTFSANELDQFAYESRKQLKDGLSFLNHSSLMPEKLSTLDGGSQETTSSHLDDVTAGTLNVSSCGTLGGTLGGTILKSHVGEKLDGVIVLEHHKRPLADVEDGLFACKRPKQLQPNLHLDSQLHSSNSQGSHSGGAGEEESNVDFPSLTNNFPSYFGENVRVRDMHRTKEIYSSFLDCYPRKLVAIGPNHQAIIPERRFNKKNPFGNKEDSDSSLPSARNSSSVDNIMLDEDDGGSMIGTCVMPMPNAATLFSPINTLHNNINCSCTAAGSARCIRQHITEVRMNLREALGHQTFAELGFYNMGESVAVKWTEEEEHLFQEVVLANLASSGKSFWNVLPRVLPSRCSKELVSYYFNVFMLRKRAGQNRLDPTNVDSDNDEWYGSDDGEYAMDSDNDEWQERSDGENAMEDEDEDEDSAVESPEEQDTTYVETYDEEVDVDEDSEESDEYAVVKDTEGRISAFSNTCTGNSSQDYLDEFPDDSCTSFEAHYNRVDFSCAPFENVETQPLFIEEHELGNDGLSAIADHSFFDGLCGPNTWNMSYTHGGQSDDFFSTCNVIEEVFGSESRNSNADSS